MAQRVQLKVCTIAPERPFLATLADELLAMSAGDPMRLPGVTVLLPTQRAVSALREAFLRTAPEGRGRVHCTSRLVRRRRSIYAQWHWMAATQSAAPCGAKLDAHLFIANSDKLSPQFTCNNLGPCRWRSGKMGGGQ